MSMLLLSESGLGDKLGSGGLDSLGDVSMSLSLSSELAVGVLRRALPFHQLQEALTTRVFRDVIQDVFTLIRTATVGGINGGAQIHPHSPVTPPEMWLCHKIRAMAEGSPQGNLNSLRATVVHLQLYAYGSYHQPSTHGSFHRKCRT